VLGALGVAGLLVGAAWWSGLAGLVVRRLSEHPWFAAGALGALAPFALYGINVGLGLSPSAPSLPMWIRGPWDIGVNLRDGGHALGTLLGSASSAAATVLVGQGVETPAHAWPTIARWLDEASGVQVALVAAVIASVAWRDRQAWRRLWSLRGAEPTPPTVLALLGLGVTATLYSLQATSRNASSIRYLVPAWIFLPGILAAGVRALPRPGRWVTGLLLVIPWGAAQLNLWADIDRPSPLRGLADALDRSRAKAIVADPPVALVVANLTHGRVGALTYGPHWPRLSDRYATRFVPTEPVTCVHDRTLDWVSGDEPGGTRPKPLGERLRELARLFPGRVKCIRRIDQFEVWEAELPLAEIFGSDSPLSAGPASAKVSRTSPAHDRATERAEATGTSKTMPTDAKLRWGILGCARITRRGLIPGLRASARNELRALASRDPATVRAWADEFQVPRTYASYQEVLRDPEIDAVYIPLPNELHATWVHAAADAGKHVLCEKPLALNAVEAREMLEHCRSRAVVLMEAFMWRHQPRTAALRGLVAEGTIGALRLIRSSFSFPIAPGDWRLDAARGGGALWDVGCYGISTARLFAGAEPEAVHAVARFGSTGVDLSLAAALRFPGGILGLVDCSFEQPFRCVYELVGAEGVIEVPDAYLPPEQPIARLRQTDAARDIVFDGKNQYAAMVDAFALAVADPAHRLPDPAEDGLAQMVALDAVLAAAC
jgi:predicted dehydrogenase